MTTRDPRSRPSIRPDSQGGGRDPTQSLALPPDDTDEPSHPSLALGTHGAGDAGRVRSETKIDSPNARGRTAPPPIRGSDDQAPPRAEVTDPDERVGRVLGSYRVDELLGKGGMGYVFRAKHVKLGREVALKLLRSDYARRRDAVARFFQEAVTVNRVRHRNIVDVTDLVELDDGTTFIIMELLRGQSLGRWARSGIDMPRALAVLVQICDGLAAAHHVGVVHRDLKPDNVFVVPTSDGAELVKLLDFGVAKLLNPDDEDVGFQTAAGSVIGTPAYMSPEQAGGMPIDARSDIYSLGAIMYELFCGQPMFRGRSFGEYVRKHLTEMPIPPSATEGGRQLDPRLELLILRCLDKDPDRRFADIGELRDALLAILGGLETHPPGYAGSSGHRPMPLVLPAEPQLPAIPAVAVASDVHPGLQPSQLPYPPYQPYSQIMLPPPPAQPVTPWWVWILGGALAIALGVTSAVWYARHTAGEPTRPPTVRGPVIVPEAPVAAPPLELRFDSLPSGGIYADGQSAELCRTPCTINLDPGDGGPADRRTYVVRSAGYRDGAIVVDLTAPRREYRVTLERAPTIAEPSKPAAAGASGDRPPARAATRPGRPSKPTARPGRGKPARAEPAARPDRAADKPPARPPAPRPDPDLIDSDDEPAPSKPAPTRPPRTIDPTDTLDPFQRRKP